ncbi:hypothetical protein EV561_1206 [Rhizobium sp. BK376]|nr:hypothetical protein EV561_1206 [Rhizobium sp. BK376]
MSAQGYQRGLVDKRGGEGTRGNRLEQTMLKLIARTAGPFIIVLIGVGLTFLIISLPMSG